MRAMQWAILLAVCLQSIARAQYLINTEGCTIPSYDMSFRDGNASVSCGKRYVFAQQVADRTVEFTWKKKFTECCYRYIKRSTVEFMEDKKVTYTPCVKFKNKAKLRIKDDFINVRCMYKKRLAYDDVYAFARRVDQRIAGHKDRKSYNVLMIGLDTMSRARAYNSLNGSVNYIQKQGWLDFRGYSKVGPNSIPNLMAVLTGRNRQLAAKKTCKPDMSACNHLLIWHKFQEHGYVTAYGEDAMHIDGFFQKHHGFRTSPTHHYMRPLFLATETKIKNTICTKRIPSGAQMLDYVLDFTKTYKNNKFFGLFWISSFSHDADQSPKPYDKYLLKLFRQLKLSGVLNNTFVIFFSDHGLRFGPARFPIEAYRDERAPMLFMWVPESFRNKYKYENLVTNQFRLTSPFDLYLTLWEILRESSREALVPKAKDCQRCVSMFQNIPERRTCVDAGIEDQWCSCHNLTETSVEEYGALYSVAKLTNYMQNLTKHITTRSCMKCRDWSFTKLRRLHSFSPNNATRYYVTSFVVNPREFTFEGTVRKSLLNNNYTYDVISLKLLSPYAGFGHCVKEKRLEQMCMCEKVAKCGPG